MSGGYDSYGGATATGDASSCPSEALWGICDQERNRDGLWFGNFEDFHTYPASEAALPTTEDPYKGYFAFTDTGGVVTQVDAEAGALLLGSDGDNEGSSIRAGSYPYKIIRGAGELIYECRVKKSVLTSDLFDFFAGLYENAAFSAIVPITATQARMADDNLIGFLFDSTTTATSATADFIVKADGNPTATTHTTIGTIGASRLTADTYIKLGFTFNRGGRNLLEYYVNGMLQSATKDVPSTQADVPSDTRLGWAFGVTNTAATTEGPTVDWVKCYQRRATL
jgi:hypothetical protein